MLKSKNKELKLVEDWHKALNNKDKRGMSELVNENVKIGGPKGQVEGVDVMLEWVDRAHILLTPKRYFSRENVIVVEEFAEWHDPETGGAVSSQMPASVFVLENELITSVHRYDDLTQALEATGVSVKDIVKM